MHVAYPEWTEYQKKNALDPLGMQPDSVNIYQHLLPGISNVTLRIRNYVSIGVQSGPRIGIQEGPHLSTF